MDEVAPFVATKANQPITVNVSDLGSPPAHKTSSSFVPEGPSLGLLESRLLHSSRLKRFINNY